MLVEVDKQQHTPLLTITEEALKTSGRYRTSVCDIEIKMEDGRYARFFINARVDGKRPKIELSTNLNNKTVSKEITGVLREES